MNFLYDENYIFLTAQNDSAKSDAVQSDSTKSDAVQSGSTKSDVAQSGSTKSDAVQSGATQSGSAQTATTLGFNPKNFVTNTSYMAKGMLGIFVALGIIIVATYLVNLLGKKKNKD